MVTWDTWLIYQHTKKYPFELKLNHLDEFLSAKNKRKNPIVKYIHKIIWIFHFIFDFIRWIGRVLNFHSLVERLNIDFEYFPFFKWILLPSIHNNKWFNEYKRATGRRVMEKIRKNQNGQWMDQQKKKKLYTIDGGTKKKSITARALFNWQTK